MSETSREERVDVGAIRARLAAITPGEWAVRELPGHGREFYVHCPDAGKPYGIEVMADEWYHTKRADAEFIANAPADVASLLAERDEILAAAGWLLRHFGPPLKRIKGQNEEFYDGYARAHAVLASRLPTGER